MGILEEITGQFIALWVIIDGVITFADFMSFLDILNSTYEPTTTGAIIYLTQIIFYLLRNAILSAVIAFPINWLLKKIGLNVSV